MSSIIQTIQKRSFFLPTKQEEALPHSQTNDLSKEQSVRRRLSLNIRPISSSPASSWAFRRSKSVSSMGEYAGGSIRKWWDWGWNLVLSRKPTFTKDLELNQQETSGLGFNNNGTWRRVFYKVRSQLRKIVRSSSDKVGLPQTYRYDSFNYSKNFDDGQYTSQH